MEFIKNLAQVYNLFYSPLKTTLLATLIILPLSATVVSAEEDLDALNTNIEEFTFVASEAGLTSIDTAAEIKVTDSPLSASGTISSSIITLEEEFPGIIDIQIIDINANANVSLTENNQEQSPGIILAAKEEFAAPIDNLVLASLDLNYEYANNEDLTSMIFIEKVEINGSFFIIDADVSLDATGSIVATNIVTIDLEEFAGAFPEKLSLAEAKKIIHIVHLYKNIEHNDVLIADISQAFEAMLADYMFNELKNYKSLYLQTMISSTQAISDINTDASIMKVIQLVAKLDLETMKLYLSYLDPTTIEAFGDDLTVILDIL